MAANCAASPGSTTIAGDAPIASKTLAVNDCTTSFVRQCTKGWALRRWCKAAAVSAPEKSTGWVFMVSPHRRSRRRYRERYLTSLRWHNPDQVIRVRSQPFLLQEGHPESTKAIIGGRSRKINLQSSEDSNNGEQSLADTPLRGSRPAFFTHALSGVAQRYLDMDGNRGFTAGGF